MMVFFYELTPCYSLITRQTSELTKSLLSKVCVCVCANIIAYAIVIHILAPITDSKDINWHVQCKQKSLGVSSTFYVKCLCYSYIIYDCYYTIPKGEC